MKPLNFSRMEPKQFSDDDPPLSDVREFSISFGNAKVPVKDEQKVVAL